MTEREYNSGEDRFPVDSSIEPYDLLLDTMEQETAIERAVYGPSQQGQENYRKTYHRRLVAFQAGQRLF